MQMQDLTIHAVQILTHLHEHQGSVQTGAMIAKSVGITYPTFTRIAVRLRNKGLIMPSTDQNGGYMLGKPAHEISFYDVFFAVERELRISLYLEDKRRPTEQGDCMIHEFLQTMQDHVIAEMSDKHIVDFS